MTVSVESDLFGTGRYFLVVDDDPRGGAFRFPIDGGALTAYMEADLLRDAIKRIRIACRMEGIAEDGFSDGDIVRAHRDTCGGIGALGVPVPLSDVVATLRAKTAHGPHTEGPKTRP